MLAKFQILGKVKPIEKELSLQSFLFNHYADSSTFLRLILKKLDRNHH